jgi:hypothetical protein
VVTSVNGAVLCCTVQDERPSLIAKHRDEAALEAAWRADTNQPTHEQSEIEATRVNQQSLQNVRSRSKRLIFS